MSDNYNIFTSIHIYIYIYIFIYIYIYIYIYIKIDQSCSYGKSVTYIGVFKICMEGGIKRMKNGENQTSLTTLLKKSEVVLSSSLENFNGRRRKKVGLRTVSVFFKPMSDSTSRVCGAAQWFHLLKTWS